MVVTVVVATVGLTGAVASGASDPILVSVGSPVTQPLMSTLFGSEVDGVASGVTSGGAPVNNQTCRGGSGYSIAQPAPDGSTEGVVALAAQEQALPDQQGCVAIVRSTSPPGSGPARLVADPHLDYLAFALDGVAPLVGSDSGATAANPLSLTLAQIQAVYRCTITHWDQLGATSHAPIVRYWPEAGSATASWYRALLGFDPTTVTIAQHCHNDLTGRYLVHEDTEATIVGAGQEDDAFFLFSAGAFAPQWDAPARFSAAKDNWSPDLTLASVDDLSDSAPHPFVDYAAGDGRGTETVDTTTVAEANEWYSHSGSTTVVPGVFYL
jgi:hypothetical protein